MKLLAGPSLTHGLANEKKNKVYLNKIVIKEQMKSKTLPCFIYTRVLLFANLIPLIF